MGRPISGKEGKEKEQGQLSHFEPRKSKRGGSREVGPAFPVGRRQGTDVHDVVRAIPQPFTCFTALQKAFRETPRKHGQHAFGDAGCRRSQIFARFISQ